MVLDSMRAFVARLSDAWKLRDAYKIENHHPEAETLVMMLIGYKPDLWSTVIPRFAAAVPAGATVCLISPGMWSEPVAQIARQHGWSYLSTKTNDVALAQNVCLKLHPAVQMVAKLDEDIYLTPGTIQQLIDYYKQLKAAEVVNPGFVAPSLNVNGFAYRQLLARLGLLQAFEQRFGSARLATTGVAVADDPEAARWMWEHTAPLEEVSARLQNDGPPLLLSPIKFSIGMIVFERSFWEEFRFFPVYRHRLMMGKNTLGADEEFLCKQCIDRSRPIVVHPRVLTGHFSFGRQYERMRALLDERPELFAQPTLDHGQPQFSAAA